MLSCIIIVCFTPVDEVLHRYDKSCRKPCQCVSELSLSHSVELLQGVGVVETLHRQRELGNYEAIFLELHFFLDSILCLLLPGKFLLIALFAIKSIILFLSLVLRKYRRL